MRPRLKDVDQLCDGVESYFAAVAETEEKTPLKSGDYRVRKETPTVIGLCNYVNISKALFYEYLNGNHLEGVQEESKQRLIDTLLRAQARCEQSLLQRAIDGDCDTRVAALLLATYGYTDKLQLECSDVTVRIAGSDSDCEQWSK